MTVTIANAQREHPVNARAIARLAQAAVQCLRLRGRGAIAITFIGRGPMRTLNRRFLRHDEATDVLSFRYDGERLAGEILIAPAAASSYAKHHGIPYRQELHRYVVHGLLHWLGHDDRTPEAQRFMRALEDRLLVACAS